jgi:hypothetical protein
VYRTTDYGRNWRNIATEEIDGFVHVIEQDPVVANLLYLGTEFGMYVSLNGGQSWFKWTEGLPTTPVRALIVHPRDHDLVIGTHGRGAYVLDDVRPLRALARGTAGASPLHLFDPPAAIQYRRADAVGYRSTGHAMFSGTNRPYGALLSYWVGAGDAEAAEIEILDGDGTVIRSMEGPVKPGINRAAWDLTRTGPEVPTPTGTRTSDGPLVLPGSYAVRITVGDAVTTGTVEVLPDPRITVPQRDREAKYAMLLRAQRQIELVTEVVVRLRDTEEAIDAVLERATSLDDSTAQALTQSGDALKERLDEVSQSFMEPPSGQGIFSGPPTTFDRLRRAGFSLGSSWDAPTEAQTIMLERAEAALDTALEELNLVFAEDVAAFRAQAQAADLALIPEYDELSIERGRLR